MCHTEINFPLHTVIHPRVGSYAISMSVLNLDYIIKADKIEDASGHLQYSRRLALENGGAGEREKGTVNTKGSTHDVILRIFSPLRHEVSLHSWSLTKYNSQRYSQNEREEKSSNGVLKSAPLKLVSGQRMGSCETGLPQKALI